MKPTKTLALLAVLALVPLVSAQATVSQQSIDLVQNATGLFVAHKHTVSQAPNGSVFHFWLPSGASAPVVRVDGAERGATRLGTEGGFERWRLNGTLTPSSVHVEYAVTGRTVELKLAYGGSVAVSALSQDGARPQVEGVNLAETSPGSWHGGLSNAAANQTLRVSYRDPDGTAPASDQNRWVWGIGGFLLGLLVLWLAVRQGWVSAPGKAKKFVKGGTMESTKTLEARRRTLMAALKDLEQGHEAKEIPDEVYYPLKEEYKQQAVRVMRTLEERRET